MSKVIKATGYRPLSHVVQTDEGKYYMVDSNNTFDQGYETMVFEWDIKNDEVENWGESYAMRYSTYRKMELAHKEVCENLEMYLEE